MRELFELKKVVTLVEEPKNKFAKFEKVEQSNSVVGKIVGKQTLKLSIVVALEHYFFPQKLIEEQNRREQTRESE